MDNLDLERYSGRWYVIKRDDDKNPQYKSRCGALEMKMTSPTSMAMHAHGYNPEKLEQSKKGFTAELIECGEHPGSSTCMVTNPKWKNKQYPFT